MESRELRPVYQVFKVGENGECDWGDMIHACHNFSEMVEGCVTLWPQEVSVAIKHRASGCELFRGTVKEFCEKYANVSHILNMIKQIRTELEQLDNEDILLSIQKGKISFDHFADTGKISCTITIN